MKKRTKRERYQRHSEREQLEHIRLHQASGQTVREYCAKQGINVATFYAMRKRIESQQDGRGYREKKPRQFIELTTPQEHVSLIVNGYELKFSPQHLVTVLSALREG